MWFVYITVNYMCVCVCVCVCVYMYVYIYIYIYIYITNNSAPTASLPHNALSVTVARCLFSSLTEQELISSLPLRPCQRLQFFAYLLRNQPVNGSTS